MNQATSEQAVLSRAKPGNERKKKGKEAAHLIEEENEVDRSQVTYLRFPSIAKNERPEVI